MIGGKDMIETYLIYLARWQLSTAVEIMKLMNLYLYMNYVKREAIGRTLIDEHHILVRYMR